MRLSTLIIIIVIVVLLLFIFGFRVREHFFGTGSLTVSWAPSTPNPQSIAYNWGACISSTPGGTPLSGGLCTRQTPAYPPGLPGPGWNYKGQTAVGQTSLVLNNTNCGNCSIGQVLTFFLQAVGPAPSRPTSNWATFTIDLSSKASVIQNTIRDGTVPTQPISPGSTGLTYTLVLNQPGFASGNTAKVLVEVFRGGAQTFLYNAYVPFTSVSSDGTTGTYVGSFLQSSANAPWNTAPGPLQAGDVVTVFASVYNAGNATSSGTVYFTGSVSQTASLITPSTPSGLTWTLAV